VVARPAVSEIPREGSFRMVDKLLENLFAKLKILNGPMRQ